MEYDRSSEGQHHRVVQDGSPSTTVVEAVADLEQKDSSDLQPLYGAIDPEALDKLFESATNGTVSFSYQNYRVSIGRDGVVTLRSEN